MQALMGMTISPCLSVGMVFNEASSAIESVHIVVLSGLLMTSFLPGCDTITDSRPQPHHWILVALGNKEVAQEKTPHRLLTFRM